METYAPAELSRNEGALIDRMHTFSDLTMIKDDLNYNYLAQKCL